MNTAPADVTPETESSPDQLGAQPGFLSNYRKHPRPGRGWRVILTAAALIAAIAWVGLRRHRPPTAKVMPTKAFTPGHVLRLKGTTEAVRARAILAPMLSGQSLSSLTIIHLAPGGTHVQKGDLLAEFDRQAQMRDYVDKQAEYQKLVDQVTQEQAKESAAKAKDETELKAAEDALRKAELEVQKNEIVSRIDGEKNQENPEETKATYDQLRETFDLKRKAAQAAIRILEIQRDRTRQTMMHAQANADLMQIHSPLDGVVVLNTIWKLGTMGEVQEGDQVRPGVQFMQVVDPSAMQVRVRANQEDFPALSVGETAQVQLDAYPEMGFRGKLDQLAPIAESGDFSGKLRTFVVIFSIEGHDPKLMPDLSAAVDVDISKPSTSQKAAAGHPESGGSGSL